MKKIVLLAIAFLACACFPTAEEVATKQARENDEFRQKCNERIHALYPGRKVTVKEPRGYRMLIYEVDNSKAFEFINITLYCSPEFYGGVNIIPMDKQELVAEGK